VRPQPAEGAAAFEVVADRVAAGGAALGLAPDGRAVFVPGAVPGERVLVTPAEVKDRFVNARLLEVLDPHPDRVAPPCERVAAGCGGCDWQHISPPGQRRLRAEIVADALRRLGRLPDVAVVAGPSLGVDGYRTTVRAVVADGRAALRAAGSHRPVVVGPCLVAHPLVAEVLAEGRFGSAREVTVRAGAATRERLVLAEPTAAGVEVPDDVVVVGADELRAGRRAWHHEVVGGHRFRISASSFFQANPEGAAALAAVVDDALDGAAGPLLDLYAGVGLFAALVGRRYDAVTAVEWSSSAVADARVNLGHRVRVVRARVERWRSEPVGAVIADPARRGLGRAAADVVAGTGAERVALVSCDPASLARDARLLVDRGYELERVTVLDLFGHTSHVEAVSAFRRR
jgi:23S rRNA (uracil1939-C5)-methyltransferase